MMRNFSCFLITHFNFSLSNFTELSSFVWLLQLSSPSLLSSATCVHSFVSFVIIQDWNILFYDHRIFDLFKLRYFAIFLLISDGNNYLHGLDSFTLRLINIHILYENPTKLHTIMNQMFTFYMLTKKLVFRSLVLICTDPFISILNLKLLIWKM